MTSLWFTTSEGSLIWLEVIQETADSVDFPRHMSYLESGDDLLDVENN